MPPEEERDYEVGYRKPPGHTRFTKGRSGNPDGRSPGAKNLKTLLSELVDVGHPFAAHFGELLFPEFLKRYGHFFLL